MEKQKTVKNTSQYSGISLHSGARTKVRLQPAPCHTGIVFRRIDLPGGPEVRALASRVIDVRRGTTIADGAAVVFTVEHIMSALHAYGIDNAIVEMDGMEPPIADGSALSFVEMIEEAGVVEQEAEAKIFAPDRPFFVDGGATKVVILPGDKLEIACTTSFAGCPFDPQFYQTEITQEIYRREICGARTFVQYSDLQMLLSMGLCKGGSLDAAAIIHDGAIICRDSLRYGNEVVRHKILDMVGDLYLCGCRVKGTVIAIKPGHPRNVELAGQLEQAIAGAKQQQECAK
ncbi:MAG: UDP-3-O-[Lentisphaeria bacterium]|nr:UDP-3-O-[3-hydroxymyristoyl] N-acetylglucosamine deacetylase [Lentisphaeria bacterium]